MAVFFDPVDPGSALVTTTEKNPNMPRRKSRRAGRQQERGRREK